MTLRWIERSADFQVAIMGIDAAVFVAVVRESGTGGEPTEAGRPAITEDVPRIDLHEARNPGGHKPR